MCYRPLAPVYFIKMDITDSPINSSKSPRSPFREISAAAAINETGSSAASVSAGNGGSLFVGKLAYDCRPRELEELFGKYGRITRCDIKRGKRNGKFDFNNFNNFYNFYRLCFC